MTASKKAFGQHDTLEALLEADIQAQSSELRTWLPEDKLSGPRDKSSLIPPAYKTREAYLQDDEEYIPSCQVNES